MASERSATVSTRRDEILAVAARVFAEKGIMNATVRDIGQEAGILSGSLYHHFESKDQMIEEVLRPVVEHFEVEIDRIVATVSEPLDIVRQMMAVSFDEAATRPEQSRIFRNDSHHFVEIPRLAFVEAQRQRIRRVVGGALERGQREGTVRTDVDPDVVAAALFDMVHGSVRWVRAGRVHELPAIGAQLVDVMLAGLAPR